MPPKPGEVYWVDLGLVGKVRPLVVVSRHDPDAARALAVCVPLTTEIRGGNYEVAVPRVRWMPGADEGVANVQGITAIEHHRLQRRSGQFEPAVVRKIRKAIAWMLEPEQASAQPSA
jgi:mRNA-degrading endonuclease toxin of MazEF toxin-antitoxin module